jgi:spore germination cell wall hydrolase CwlJ-like protein
MRSPGLLPVPNPDQASESWPTMVLYAAVVLLEAEGEPDEGQLGVAWVVRNRVDRRWPAHASVPEVEVLNGVLLAPYAFSCLLPAYAPQRQARLTGMDPHRWEMAWKWTAAAWWRLLPDPTSGASHYLNEAVTRAGRPKHDLPTWFEEDKIVARIGRHTFLTVA